MGIAALLFWLVTAVFGFVMLATWVTKGGARSDGASQFRPPLILGHFLLAGTGLVLWIVYLVVGATALAWIAFVLLLVVAGLGDVMVLRWWKTRRSAPVAAAAGAPEGTGGGVDLAEQHFPTPVVAIHGLVAVTTVVLVLLTALGVG